MFKLCPGDVVLEVFCFLITLVLLDTEVLLSGHNINTNRYGQFPLLEIPINFPC